MINICVTSTKRVKFVSLLGAIREKLSFHWPLYLNIQCYKYKNCALLKQESYLNVKKYLRL